MLFWVTMRGRDRILSKPRDSAIVRITSRRYAFVALIKLRPLVGPLAGKFEKSGMAVCVAAPVLFTMYWGAPVFALSGEVPALPAPPTAAVLLPQPKATWVPMSRAKLRVAA